MPHAVDLPVSSGRSSKQVARANRTTEPKSRFDDILSNRSRAERSREPDASKPADDVAAKKTDRPERPDKPEKKSESEDPDRDRVDESDDTQPEPQATVAEETSESPTVDAPAGDETLVVEEGVEEEQEADGGESIADDNGVVAADPAFAVIANVPAAEGIASETTDSDEAGDEGSASLGSLDLTKLAAKPATGTKPATSSGTSTTADPAADESADEGVQASGLKLPEDVADSEGEAVDAGTLPQPGGSKVDAAAPAAAQLSAPAEADTDATASLQPTAPAKPVTQAAPVAQPQAVQHPDDRFVEQNVDRIVTGIKSDLTPNGGTMKIRLDPPNLGQLNIDVTLDEGVLTASFQTTNDEATRLLSHSMQQLKQTLESAGVSVDKIQVRQTSSSEQSSNSRSGDQDQQQQQNAHDHPQRQEQQRREALQKMWAKLALGEEPLDMVA